MKRRIKRTARPKQKLSPVGLPRPKLSRLTKLSSIMALLLMAAWISGAIVSLTNGLAQRSLRRLDTEGAQWWLTISESIYWRNAETLLLRARMARQAGQFEQMNMLLDQCAQAGGGRQRIRAEEVMAQAQVGQLAAVEDELLALLPNSASDQAEMSAAFANGLAIRGRLDELLELLQAWERDFPNDPRPNHRRGLALEFNQSPLAAAEQYQLAVEKNRNHFPSWYGLGRIRQSQRKTEEALEAYRECLRMSNPLAAEIAIAGCLRELGEFDQARAILQRMLQVDRATLAASYYAVEYQPDGDSVARELGTMESEAGNFERASQILEIALEKEPRDLLARYAYAVALRGLSKQAEAERNFEQVKVAREALAEAPPLLDRVNRDPLDTEARLRLAEIHLQWESERQGVYWLQSVLAYEPHNAHAQKMLAEHDSKPTAPH